MSKTMKQILEEALELSDTERAELAEQLFQSVDPMAPDIRSAWDSEIGKRIEDLEQGRVKPVPWSEVKERLRKVIKETGSRSDV